MTPIVEWARLTWPEAQREVERMPACLVPFGAIEAHGPHMALDLDTVISEAESRLVCERTGLILMPAQPYGQAWSLYDFPGTLSLSVPTLVAVVADIVRSLRDHGFRLVFIHSGHLGNITALRLAMRDCHRELPDVKAVLLDCLEDAVADAADMLSTPRSHPGLIHSCEIETSMALALSADRVRMERAVSEYPAFPHDFDFTPTPWSAVTSSGVLGDATAATADKGRAIVEADVERMVRIVELELSDLAARAESAARESSGG